MKLENLSIRFGDKVIFDQFTYSFPKEGVFVVDGVSGKGKTTLFNIISGVLNPDSGLVDVQGKKVAYMFQEDRLFAEFTVLENLLSVTGGSADETALCKTVLRDLGLQNELSSYPSDLSGGMCRRVALARMLVYAQINDSDILLFDEPFKGLDEETCINAINTIFKYAQGKLIILAAHMMDRNLFGKHTVITI